MTAVTVLMPVYNAERYLRGAVDSVLNQTFGDFELLVINDGSNDGSREILAGYVDPRIRIVDTENRGVAASLRLGMELARGGYVARMDADDECLPERLALQKAHLDSHPGVILVHSRVDLIDAAGRLIAGGVGDAGTADATRWSLVWHNVPYHSAVMLRVAAFRMRNLNYETDRNLAEDFDLWNRAVLAGDFHMLAETLLRYRVHAGSVTKGERASAQLEAQSRVIADSFLRYGIALDPESAKELAIISGSTRLAAEDYRYEALRGRLLPLLQRFNGEFANRFQDRSRALREAQAQQLLLWARNMLNTSRAEAMALLVAALRQRPALLSHQRCWATIVGVAIPRHWMAWIAAVSRGRRARRVESAS